MNADNWRIELKSGIWTGMYAYPIYEVWFTQDGRPHWLVSKAVPFERAMELMRFMHECCTTKRHEVTLLPEEFHVVARHEPKLIPSGESK